MQDSEAFQRYEEEANRLKELAGGIDGWLDLFPVQDEDGQIRVRVFPGSMYKFEVDAENMAENIVAVLRQRLAAFEEHLKKK